MTNYLTTKEVAKILNLTPKKIREFITNGCNGHKLTAIKLERIYRVNIDDLNNFISKKKTIYNEKPNN